ncbi:MAG TPA: cytosolic protein [Candidatus Woesearchaeota archaeon]|nr:cytosolic protein [Candidatus Woesearchaeota archaeon]
MICDQKQMNLEHCNCTYERCDKKGNCCACLRYHLSMNELPACCFPPEVEKTFDRSFKKFIEIHTHQG